MCKRWLKKMCVAFLHQAFACSAFTARGMTPNHAQHDMRVNIAAFWRVGAADATMQLRKRKQAEVETTAEPMKLARVAQLALTDHFRTRKTLHVQTASGKLTASKLMTAEVKQALSVAADGASHKKAAPRKRAPKAAPAPAPASAAAQEADGALGTMETPQRRKRTAKAATAAAVEDAPTGPPLPPLTQDTLAVGMAHIASAHPRAHSQPLSMQATSEAGHDL